MLPRASGPPRPAPRCTRARPAARARARRSMRPSRRRGDRRDAAPRSPNARRLARACGVKTIAVRGSSSSIFARQGIRSANRAPRAAADAPSSSIPGSRTVSADRPRAPCRSRSARPLRGARSRCTSARAASPVIQWLAPFGERRAPVEARAELDGHPRPAARHARRKPRLSSAASRSSNPPRRRCRPRELAQPAAGDSRVRIEHAHTTRATPGREQRRVQGGVRPKCEQGLERHVCGRAARARRLPRARAPPRAGRRCAMPALAHDAAVAHQHAADAGFGGVE